MTQILAVSKAGKNVLTETDPNSFIFRSAYNTFKILAHGTVSVAVSDTGAYSVGQTTVAHGMSVIPFVIAFTKLPISGRACLSEAPEPTSYSVAASGYAVDATNIRFYITNHLSNTTRTFVFSYFICEVPL
jgi:hypothetical protein